MRRPMVPHTSPPPLIWIPRFFFVVGIILLGYVAATLLDVSLHQAHQAFRFEYARQSQERGSPPAYNQSPNLPLARVRIGEPDRGKTQGRGAVSESPAWGRIEIASTGLSAMIEEGIDPETLQRGVGHIPGTALPGQPGNVALAGHRDTFFRRLRNIRKNDEIILETLDGSYHYRVDLTQVVTPRHMEILDGSDAEILTLVTCYPFSFVGPAPERFVVRAHRVHE